MERTMDYYKTAIKCLISDKTLKNIKTRYYSLY